MQWTQNQVILHCCRFLNAANISFLTFQMKFLCIIVKTFTMILIANFLHRST